MFYLTSHSQADNLSIVDKVPIYPGCENFSSQENLKKCMSRLVQRHIEKKFDLDVFYKDTIPEGQYKITLVFKINDKGYVIEANAKAQYKVLREEAIRVIESIPAVIPGQHEGVNVTIPYSIPIQLTSFVTEKDRKRREKRLRRLQKKSKS